MKNIDVIKLVELEDFVPNYQRERKPVYISSLMEKGLSLPEENNRRWQFHTLVGEKTAETGRKPDLFNQF